MTQERPRVRIEKKQYFDRNIWDMSIDITYFVLDILQVVISRSTYYISFERMCLTDICIKNKKKTRSLDLSSGILESKRRHLRVPKSLVEIL